MGGLSMIVTGDEQARPLMKASPVGELLSPSRNPQLQIQWQKSHLPQALSTASPCF